MDIPRTIRLLLAAGCAWALSATPAPAARAELPPASTGAAPVPPIAADPEFDHWVQLLVRQSSSANAEVARSAQSALDGLGARGRERADALRREPRAGPGARHGLRADPPAGQGPAVRGQPGASHGPRERPDGAPRPVPDRPGPRELDRPAGPPPRCGPGCCLHGRGARDGVGLPPPPRDGRGPRHGAPPDFDPDPRAGPRPGRAPRPPLPSRDDPSRPPRSSPQET